MDQKRKIKWVIPICCLILLTAGLGWWFIVVQNIADEVIIEAGSTPLASDYLIRDLGKPAEFETDLSVLDLTHPGSYELQILYDGRSYAVRLSVRDSIAPTAVTQELTVFATQRPEPGDFLTEIQDVTEVTVTYKTEPDMTLDGTQKVVLVLTDQGGNITEVNADLTVIQDDTPPVIDGVQEIRWYIGYELDYLAGITVSDDLDPGVQLDVDDSRVDLTTPGTYGLTYTARDACGNQTREETTITVLTDTTPPQILGAINRSLSAGGSISYRSGIFVRDNVDESPDLRIDSSAVDLSKPGRYSVIYYAADNAGNEASCEITVTVYEKASYFVDESVIYDEADRVLARIITEDMTVQQQVETIYRWLRSNFTYNSYADKRDWKQSAYTMLKHGYGDCFSFFSVSKLMFERLGIPNIDVRRMWTYSHSNDHFWNMVSIDGGENYYYFDATPFPGADTWFCLVTDADLDAFSAQYGNYFSRDRSILPSTPLERP